MVWALQTPSTELNWLLSQLPFSMATHILPLTASRLSTKSRSTCCTLSFTATTYKGIFWRYSCKLSATLQTLYTYLKSNLMLVLLVMSARTLWPSIKQPKLTQILQTQGCHALVLIATLFITQLGLHTKGISPLMQHPQGPPTYLPQSSFISQISMMLWRHICTPNINLATQTIQPVTSHISNMILQRFTSLSPQEGQQRFLDNVRSVLKDENNIFHYHTGTLFNQKHAVRFKTSTSLQCPLCHHSDSALHILLGCEHQIISSTTTVIIVVLWLLNATTSHVDLS